MKITKISQWTLKHHFGITENINEAKVFKKNLKLF